jgi:hypothetical protein
VRCHLCRVTTVSENKNRKIIHTYRVSQKRCFSQFDRS